MTEIKVKKSVALSGVPAGNTALSAVGGADLHYRGYSIKDLAANCQFEEVAYLLVHGALPNQAQLDAYKAKLKGLRGLSPQVKTVLEQLPASAHAMDVLRTGFSALGASAFRAMNKAAENVYTAIRRDGTQSTVIDTMQTREELYQAINYYEYEKALDQTLGKDNG